MQVKVEIPVVLPRQFFGNGSQNHFTATMFEVHSRLSTCLMNLPTLSCSHPRKQSEKCMLDNLAKQLSAVRIGKQRQACGKKFSIHYNNQPLTELTLTHEELNAIAHHAGNTEALLFWLNETFGDQNEVIADLLSLLPSPNAYEPPVNEESYGKLVHGNVSQAIKRSGSDFVLELDLPHHGNSQALSTNPFSAIVTAHDGKEKKGGFQPVIG